MQRLFTTLLVALALGALASFPAHADRVAGGRAGAAPRGGNHAGQAQRQARQHPNAGRTEHARNDARPQQQRGPDRDNNPPGPRGGRGTNWENPPGPMGGPGASPDRQRPRLDRDNNPPGPRGGRGTNWENPPGPAGGPGASPDRRPPRPDRDNNPPRPRGGRGTNWENPPGPTGGPGASPDRRLPPPAVRDP